MLNRAGFFVFVLFLLLALAVAAGISASRTMSLPVTGLDISPSEFEPDLEPLPEWISDPLPDFTALGDVALKKEAFFDYLFPRVALANQRVMSMREQVAALAGQPELDEAEAAWLGELAGEFRIEEEVGSEAFFAVLDRRLDIIPPSLVLAQAANESAWGTSRFARQGNNLFGQWCFAKGCGLVPLRRGDNASHEVADFDTPYQSIRSYIINLNRHPSYQDLRDQRARLRAADQLPTGQALAPGLTAYSARGEAYVRELVSMIRYNELHRYDQLQEAWLAGEEIAGEFEAAPILLSLE